MPKPKGPTGAVWRVLDGWREQEKASDPYLRAPTQGAMADMFGVSGQLLSGWKYMQSRMQASEMAVVETTTGIAFGVLSAALKEDLPVILKNIADRRGLSQQDLRDLRALEDEAASTPKGDKTTRPGGERTA